jgi:hypothetical protein
MKTFTEFSGFQLREASAKSKELQAGLAPTSAPAEGGQTSTPEELATAHREALAAYLTEKFKLEGDRLSLFVEALEVTHSKPRELQNLKRVVVYAVAEGEKTPSQVHVRGGHGFAAEYLAPVRGPNDRRQSGKHAGKGGKGGKGDRKKRGRGRRQGQGQNQRRDATGRPAGSPPSGGPAKPTAKPQERRGPNAPR